MNQNNLNTVFLVLMIIILFSLGVLKATASPQTAPTDEKLKAEYDNLVDIATITTHSWSFEYDEETCEVTAFDQSGDPVAWSVYQGLSCHTVYDEPLECVEYAETFVDGEDLCTVILEELGVEAKIEAMTLFSQVSDMLTYPAPIDWIGGGEWCLLNTDGYRYHCAELAEVQFEASITNILLPMVISK